MLRIGWAYINIDCFIHYVSISQHSKASAGSKGVLRLYVIQEVLTLAKRIEVFYCTSYRQGQSSRWLLGLTCGLDEFNLSPTPYAFGNLTNARHAHTRHLPYNVLNFFGQSPYPMLPYIKECQFSMQMRNVYKNSIFIHKKFIIFAKYTRCAEIM